MEKKAWITQNLAKMAPVFKVVPQSQLPIEGKMTLVRHRPNGPSHLSNDAVLIGGNANHFGAKVQGVLKAYARARLAAACDYYAAKAQKSYDRIVLSDPRSRWGSCSSKGRLMFSWRLIMAPADVLSYVAAHEVAHLRYMNHSAAFWQFVAHIHGPWQKQRAWLNENGASLHRYRFDD